MMTMTMTTTMCRSRWHARCRCEWATSQTRTMCQAWRISWSTCFSWGVFCIFGLPVIVIFETHSLVCNNSVVILWRVFSCVVNGVSCHEYTECLFCLCNEAIFLSLVAVRCVFLEATSRCKVLCIVKLNSLCIVHLILLRTEKYPIENEWESYIAERGGYSNATTGKRGTGTQYLQIHSGSRFRSNRSFTSSRRHWRACFCF